MDSTATQPDLAPTPDSYTLQEWLRIYHNMAQVPRSDARYAEVRALMHQAFTRINEMHHQQNVADLMQPPPTGGDAFLRGAAQGGLSGFGDELTGSLMAAGGHGTAGPNIDFMRQQMGAAQSAHPFLSGAGDVAGMAANPLMKLLGPLTAGMTGAEAGATGGAVLGGAHGLGSGTGPVGERLPSAAIGTAAGAVGGATVGKVLGGVVPKLLENVKGAFGGGATQAAEDELIGGTSVGVIRQKLAKQGFAPADIERALQSARAQTAPPGGAAAQAPQPQLPGTMGPIPGTKGRGFEVTGERAMPAVPTAPTLTEIHEALAGKPSASGPANVSSAMNLVETLRDVAKRLGRALTPEEKEQVLGKVLEGTKLGEPTIPGRPDLGTNVPAAKGLVAPATRSQSPSSGNLVMQAIRLSGQEPKLLEPIPTAVLQSNLEFAKAAGMLPSKAMKAVEAELAKRAGATK